MIKDLQKGLWNDYETCCSVVWTGIRLLTSHSMIKTF